MSLRSLALLAAGLAATQALAGGPPAADPLGPVARFQVLHPTATQQAPAPWVLEQLPVELPTGRTATLRAGYLPENPDVPFRGNVVYLEGFSDSMRNHDAFFQEVTTLGYRLVAFDYPGQGGSEGTMNWTRVKHIPDMAEAVAARFSRPDGPPTRTWMGWSTGGLAAYQAAAGGRVDRVVLLAPGIHIKPLVGEWGSVTPRTLTGHEAAGLPDPHVEPPRPTAPAKVPFFAASILKNSIASQHVEIPASVEGLVLLSGDGDRYVRGDDTRRTLARNAPHFDVRTFEDALHELHEEVDPIGAEVRGAVIEFLAASP
jgi:alpha-beta hydrolase superfamily lysophospholipase